MKKGDERVSLKTWLITILLGLSSILTLFSSLAIAVMKDSYQRLHYSSVVVGLSAPLIGLAIWIESQSVQARIKIILIIFLLFITNGVLNHAIARAHRVRSKGHWHLGEEDRDVIREET